MKKVAPYQIASLCSLLIAILLVLLPFHAVLTVWAGSNFGHYETLRLWIEVLLVPLTALTAYTVYRHAGLRKSWRRDVLVWACAAYILWQMLLGLYALHAGWVNSRALLTGWATDLRFVAFMLVCWAIAAQRPWLLARWRPLLFAPAAAAVGFGVLQTWLLPADFLRHFGYGSGTIPSFTTVDQKVAYVRVQSTLRGPNPFGAYLVLPISALITLLVRGVQERRRMLLFVFLALACVALGATYSRSAYIGAVLSVVYISWLSLPSKRARDGLLAVAAVAVLVAGAAFVALRHNDRFENTFFHTDEHSQSVQSSNQARSWALQQGVKDILKHPLGGGPGSAGPASVRNSKPPRIAENYYLQIGQEAGWIGLGLFVAINVCVVNKLWQRRTQQFALVLLASFVGISFINMLSHAWADDTLGMLWWGLTGLACALPAVRSEGAKNAAIETVKKKAAA